MCRSRFDTGELLGAADAGSPLGRLHALRQASVPSDIIFRLFAPTLLTPTSAIA